MYRRIGEGWGVWRVDQQLVVVWCTMMLVKGKPRLPQRWVATVALIRISPKTCPADVWRTSLWRLVRLAAINFDKKSCIVKLRSILSILLSTMFGLNSWSYCLGRFLLPSYHFYFTTPCSVHPAPYSPKQIRVASVGRKKVASIPPYAIEANSSNTVIMQMVDLCL